MTFPEPSSRLGFINGLSNHKNISANREDTNGKNRKLQHILAIFVISCDCATWPDKYQIWQTPPQKAWSTLELYCEFF